MSTSLTALVLAAGRGTRMGALTASTPKPLLALQGRPILEHILRGLASAGVERAVVITGYLADAIESHFGAGEDIGIRLVYRRQAAASGTAKAVLLARDLIGDAPFVLSWGDILVEPGAYADLVADFRSRPCAALLGINEVDDPWRGAAVYTDGDTVTRVVEKPPPGTSTTRWNNAGVFVLSPVVFDYAERLEPSPRGEYELPQAFAAMIADGLPVRAHRILGFWSDVGTPEDLDAAQTTFPSALPPLSHG